MAGPKSQHFVHRAYLEGFQDPELERRGEFRLWVYMRGKSPFLQRPERVAKRNYYYCYHHEEQRQFQAEHAIQKLEDTALPALRQLRSRQFSLSPEDRLTFAGYIALSHVRVPTFEKSLNRIACLIEAHQLEFIANDSRAIKWVVSKMREQTGEDIEPEDFRKKLTGGSVILEQANRQWTLGQMFKTTLTLQQVIFGMKWTFLLAGEEDDGFLTSDNPVSLFDPIRSQSGGIGFASSAAAHFTFPISRNVCLLAQHLGGPDLTELNASQVRFVNRGTIVRADSQVYGPFKSASVQKIFDSVGTGTSTPRRVLFRKGRVVEE